VNASMAGSSITRVPSSAMARQEGCDLADQAGRFEQGEYKQNNRVGVLLDLDNGSHHCLFLSETALHSPLGSWRLHCLFLSRRPHSPALVLSETGHRPPVVTTLISPRAPRSLSPPRKNHTRGGDVGRRADRYAGG
jgi:hypothetical protein